LITTTFVCVMHFHTPTAICYAQLGIETKLQSPGLSQWRSCAIMRVAGMSPVPPEDRSIVFITGRIHRGESNSSFLVHGLIGFLLSDDPLAQCVLEHTIVKCVPMINIDGVIAGYYRISLHEYDLNRMWRSPDRVLEPIVYETKR
jgi:murein tripeptide amidase MpaA